MPKTTSKRRCSIYATWPLPKNLHRSNPPEISHQLSVGANRFVLPAALLAFCPRFHADPPWAAGGKKIRNRQRRPDARVRHTPGKDTQIPPLSCPPPGGPQLQGQPSGQPANAGQPFPPASSAARRDADDVVGCRDMQAASKHGFWARTSLHGSGMAITPWQPAPDMVAAPLKRRSHGTVPGQFSANLRASHGSGIASTTVKILHKVLPAPKIHITNMLQNLIVIHLINRIQFIAYHGMRPSE